MTMTNRLSGYAIGFILIIGGALPAQSQQVEMKTQFESDGPSALSPHGIAVVVDAEGLPPKPTAELNQAVAEVARTLGLDPIASERVTLAIKARGRIPSGESDARALAQFLGVGRVLVVRVTPEDKEHRLSVLGVNARTGISAQEGSVSTRASLAAQTRAVTAEVLAALSAPPPASLPPQSLPVPTPVVAPLREVAPPPPPLVQVPPPAAPVVTSALPPRSRPKQSVNRGAGVFGVTVGAQAIAMLLCYALYLEVEDNGQKTEYMDWAIGYSLATPLLSSAAALGIASARSSYRYNYGSMLIGAYLGSAVAFGLGAAAHYGLGEVPSESPLFWPLTHVVLPLVLPAAGAAIFHRMGAKPKETKVAGATYDERVNRRLTYLPPTVAVSRGATAGTTLSLSLGTLVF